jgi:hypothetical protein
VIYHDRFAETSGTIRESAAYARKNASGAKRLVRRSLADGLGLPTGADDFVTFRDARTGLEYVRSCRELRDRGFSIHLGAYEGHVFWEFQEVHDGSSGQWRRLAERLAGAGTPSLDAAMRELQLEPVHAPLRAVFDGPAVGAVLDGTAADDDLDRLEAAFAAFLTAVAAATGVTGDPTTLARTIRDRAVAGFRRVAASSPPLERADRAAVLGWLALAPMGALADGPDVPTTSAAWFDELRLGPVLAGGFRRAGLDEADAWAAAERVRVLLRLPRPSSVTGRGTAARDMRLLERWFASEPVRAALGVNTWQGSEFVDRDRFADLLAWATRLDAIEFDQAPDDAFVARGRAAAETAGYVVAKLRGAKPAAGPRAMRPRRPEGSRPTTR